jgi:hypothetical protein
VVEQGTAHTGMLQTQGLTAFDSSRGVLLALLENGPFMRGHEASPTSYRPHPGSALANPLRVWHHFFNCFIGCQ